MDVMSDGLDKRYDQLDSLGIFDAQQIRRLLDMPEEEEDLPRKPSGREQFTIVRAAMALARQQAPAEEN